jgi:DNA-directed RNA polymerase specialized sigma subunit
VARAYVGTYAVFEREQFLTDQLPVVRAMARSLVELLEGHPNQEELIQAGILGLLNALSDFDPLLGEEFAEFAKNHVLAAISQCLQAHSTQGRISVAVTKLS